jgi:ADP-ribose pyrophosphatase
MSTPDPPVPSLPRHGPWQIRASHQVYRDPWVEVQQDEVVRPDGRDGTHVVVRLKPGVSVLALDDEGSVYLTEEFHYAVGRYGLEAVSGGIEPGESALATAQRELREELGIEAEAWTELGVVDPFTSVVVSPTRLYLARRLRFVAAAPEGTEQIRRVQLPLAEAARMVAESRITHGPSCLLILRAYFERGGATPYR